MPPGRLLLRVKLADLQRKVCTFPCSALAARRCALAWRRLGGRKIEQGESRSASRVMFHTKVRYTGHVRPTFIGWALPVCQPFFVSLQISDLCPAAATIARLAQFGRSPLLVARRLPLAAALALTTSTHSARCLHARVILGYSRFNACVLPALASLSRGQACRVSSSATCDQVAVNRRCPPTA